MPSVIPDLRTTSAPYTHIVTLPRRADCEVARCNEPALLRELFVDADGYWTWLCRPHFNRVVGWHV